MKPTPRPTVHIQCFGVLQRVCGGAERDVPVNALPVKVADVLKALAADIPDMRRYLDYTACAIGDNIVHAGHAVQAGETLVLLPPVSGG